MRTRIYFETDRSSGALGGDADELLSKQIAEHLRALCACVSGPHRLEDAWDLNCRFGQGEFWILLRQKEAGWVLEIDSVWDFLSFGSHRTAVSDLEDLQEELYRRLSEEPTFSVKREISLQRRAPSW